MPKSILEAWNLVLLFPDLQNHIISKKRERREHPRLRLSAVAIIIIISIIIIIIVSIMIIIINMIEASSVSGLW